MIHRLKSSKNNQGSILIVTLWIVALLSLLALTIAGRTRLAIRQTSWIEREAVANQVLYAMAERCVRLIQSDQNADMDAYTEAWGQRIVLSGDELSRELGLDNSLLLELRATIIPIDESGKININFATQMPDLLEDCLSEMSSDINPKILSGHIIGWWDEDIDGVGENESYTDYVVMNGDLRFIEELLFINEITPWLFWGEDSNHNGILESEEDDGDLFLPLDNSDGQLQAGLISMFTTYGNDNYALNINGVSKPVLRSILRQGVDDSEIDDLLNSFFEYRQGIDGLDGTEDDQAFDTLDDLSKVWKPEEIQKADQILGIEWATQSSAYRFNIDIHIGGHSTTKRASIVILREEGEVSIAEWHEE